MPPSERPDHREPPRENQADDPVFLPSGEADHWLSQGVESGRTEETGGGNQKRGPRRFFRFARRMVLVSLPLFLLLIAAVATTLYLSRHWLRTEVESRLMVELERQNIHLAYESADYHFTRGLLLHHVTLYESQDRKKRLLTCSELGFTFDVLDFAKQEFRGDVATSFTTWDARIVCYEGGEAVATIDDLRVEIRGSESEVSVDRFAGRIGELEFELEGRILASREQRRQREERQRQRRENSETRKVADFAFFHEVMPWLQVVGDQDGYRPQIRAEFVVDPTAAHPVTVRGQFTGNHFAWREIPIDAATVEFGFAEGDTRLQLPHFNLIYGGDLISGEAVWDSASQTVEVARFHSSADLLGLLRRLDPSITPFAAMIQQDEAPLIKASGLLNLADFWKSDLRLDLRQAGGLTLLLDPGDLRLEGISGALRIADGVVSTESLRLSALGGRVEASGSAALAQSPLSYEGTLTVTGLPLQGMVDYFGGDKELPGMLTAQFEGRGGVQMATLNGVGKVRVDAAKFYEVPVIGPVQSMMGSVVPVFGGGKRSELSATFTVSDGVLTSEDLVVHADGTRVEVAGQLDLSNWQTRFEAEGNLVGALGLVTGLVSKALVVEGSGRVDELDLKMKNVPAEFASEAVKGIFGVAGTGVNLVTDTVGTGFEGAQQVAGGALKITGAVIEGGADAVRSVGQKTGEGVRVMGDGATLIGETGRRGIEGGARMVGQGAKRLGEGLLRIIPGNQRGEGETTPPLTGPPDPEDLEKTPPPPVIAD